MTESLSIPPSFKLSKMEEKLLVYLMGQSKPTKAMMMEALYGDYYVSPEILMPDIKIIDVMVCKLRKKLEPFGVVIMTYWGRGYYLTELNKDQVRMHCGMEAAHGSVDAL